MGSSKKTTERIFIRKIQISDSAYDDLNEARLFYESQCEGLGSYFQESIFADIDSIKFYAGIHFKTFGKYRLLSKRFPYAIYFTIKYDTVCTTNETQQKAENIKLLFEIKMSIVNNYKYENNRVTFTGDYKKHKGNPSILRSDSMLKAIGKLINIRVSGTESTRIPIVILGNSPITKNYAKKVDFLKNAGIIQSFISIYPNPTDDCIENTEKKGFQTFDDYNFLTDYIKETVNSEMNFFSSMLPKRKLGQIISISAREKDDISKAEKFLTMINE